MPADLARKAIEKAGLENAFDVIDPGDLSEAFEKVRAQNALADDSAHRFLQSIVTTGVFPATWQKLANLGWADEEITSLIDNNLVTEAATTLVAAINSGALTLNEYDEFVNYPNQEVDILYYTKDAQEIIAFIAENVTLPKLNEEAFVE